MKTIETRYISASNTKSSRIVATDCGDHKIYVQYEHAFNSDQNHMAAARQLMHKEGR